MDVKSILEEGEGQKVEFKEGVSSLASEMVAFANANGGHIYLGITDSGNIKPIRLTNRLKSQIADMARNCDPSIKVKIAAGKEGIVLVEVAEGQDKPYKCKEGFFLRTGPNSQKLTRDEIVHLISHAGKIRFDEIINEDFVFPRDFDERAWEEFRKLAGYPPTMRAEEALANIGVVSFQEGKPFFTNSAILFFGKNPQKIHPEAKITCLKYRGETRYDITDRREFGGVILEQLHGAMSFFDRYNARQIKISGSPQHEEWEDYPTVSVREAIINALIHRDYFYDSSHIYMHMYDNRLEIDNPGGLMKGMTIENLGTKAARRNRMMADLMRMKESMRMNNNPPPEISETNFFSIKMNIRPKDLTETDLTERQKKLYAFVVQRKEVSKTDCQMALGIGSDTTLNELKILLAKGLLEKKGKGKNTRYFKR